MQRGWARSALAVALRPHLWVTAARQTFDLARPGWWRHRPFLPLPDAAYLGFRLQTAYGDAHRAPSAEDVVTYLAWCRDYPSARRRGRAGR